LLQYQTGDFILALNSLGILENEVGQFDAAEEVFGRVLRLAVDDEDEGDQARAKMHLGIVHRSSPEVSVFSSKSDPSSRTP
jgi:hypothetical protein